MSVITTLQRKLQKANKLHKDFGVWAAVQHAANQIGGPAIDFEATVIVWLEPKNLNIALDLPDDTEMRFLSPEEVESFAEDSANDLRDDLVAKAYAGTDLCFAGLVDGRLASYGWYSLAPDVPADDFGLMMTVPKHSAYMHNGFTHPNFRGRRLHGIGMGRALQALSERGIDALLSDVDWANHASLRSCWRLGYTNLGNLYTFGRGKKRFTMQPRSAISVGVTFQRKTTDESKQMSAPMLSGEHAVVTHC